MQDKIVHQPVHTVAIEGGEDVPPPMRVEVKLHAPILRKARVALGKFLHVKKESQKEVEKRQFQHPVMLSDLLLRAQVKSAEQGKAKTNANSSHEERDPATSIFFLYIAWSTLEDDQRDED